jgi:lipoprotein NlpI
VRRNGALLAACLLLSGVCAAAPSEFPLLDLAAELTKERPADTRADTHTSNLRQARHALEQANPPGDAECSRSLGAATFADLHDDVARSLKAVGDYAGAAAAFRRALACRPRSARVSAALAEVLFDARDFSGARVAIHEALDVNPRAIYANRVAGNLDFVEERWADAVARFRYVAASDPDRNQAGYGQLMLWLAQWRAGVGKPEFVTRRAGEEWPQPLLLYMRGEYTEAELLEPIRDGNFQAESYGSARSDERLCEALYYVGQAHWARGHPDVARRYFATLVNLRVIYYLEHGLAMAEIAKMGVREDGGAAGTPVARP